MDNNNSQEQTTEGLLLLAQLIANEANSHSQQQNLSDTAGTQQTTLIDADCDFPECFEDNIAPMPLLGEILY